MAQLLSRSAAMFISLIDIICLMYIRGRCGSYNTGNLVLGTCWCLVVLLTNPIPSFTLYCLSGITVLHIASRSDFPGYWPPGKSGKVRVLGVVRERGKVVACDELPRVLFLTQNMQERSTLH